MFKVIVCLIVFGILCLAIKAGEIHFNLKLLDRISDDVKNELGKTPTYLLMDENTKREFKKVRIKTVSKYCVFMLILNIAICLLFLLQVLLLLVKGIHHNSTYYGQICYQRVFLYML